MSEIITPGLEVFVSGSVREIDEVQALQAELEQLGCVLAHDWTTTRETMLAGKENKLAHPEEAARRAQLDLEAAARCDAFVYVAPQDPAHAPGTMVMELGAAVGARIARRSANLPVTPDIYFLGRFQNAGRLLLGYFSPEITVVETRLELFDRLGALTLAGRIPQGGQQSSDRS
ncbi:MAG TPA: hypothetical protein VFT16_02400 [Candidatus Saccharimonadales bacterium]|nr:hypothetical protein [Candidatus Saccharimonadales bacterium]